MALPHDHSIRRRGRRLWLGLAGVLLLVAAAGVFRWWLVRDRVTAEERPFVGVWRLESPTFSPSRPELVVEIDLLPDGTRRDRVWDSRTGEVLHDIADDGRWHVSNGRLQQVIEGDRLLKRLGMIGRVRVTFDRSVTWEGPDRIKLDSPSDVRSPRILYRVNRDGRLDSQGKGEADTVR